MILADLQLGKSARKPQESQNLVDTTKVERRIAKRYVTDTVVEIWIPRKGVLGRARTAEVPVADLSMFGASVYASKSEKIARGQVVEVAIGNEKSTAIVRSERESGDSKKLSRYGLEFIKPSDAFLNEVRMITESCRRMVGEDISHESMWLRSG